MLKTKLSHFGYVVENLSASYEQFCKEGARCILPPVIDPVQNVEVCLLRLAEAELPIELIAPLSDQSSPISARLARGGGLDHICFDTNDIQTALMNEATSGAIVVCPPVHSELFKTQIAFVYRKSGMMVEYIHRADLF